MPRPTNPARFAPPLSLGNLDVRAVRAVARYCPGAWCTMPKQNETFRYRVGDLFIIGYRHRAVVTGSNEHHMGALAATLRTLADQCQHPERCPHVQTACCPVCGFTACFLCNDGHGADCDHRHSPRTGGDGMNHHPLIIERISDGETFWLYSKGHHQPGLFLDAARRYAEHEDLGPIDRNTQIHSGHGRQYKDFTGEFAYIVDVYCQPGRGAFPVTWLEM